MEQKEERYGKFITQSGAVYETGVIEGDPEDAQSREDPQIYAYFEETQLRTKTGELECTLLEGNAAVDKSNEVYSVGIRKTGCTTPNITNVDKVTLCYNKENPASREMYDYTIWVYGGGPEGYHPSWLNLSFTDESNDMYELKLYNHSKRWHYLKFSSKQPAIKKIRWLFR